MPVPSSGMISLNDFHVEAGGTSGSACTLNDADIRGLISKGSGAAMNFNEWYGASALIHSSTVVTGYQASQYFSVSGYNGGSFGSMSDTNISSFNGLTDVTIYRCVRTGSAGSEKLTLILQKNNQTISNAGFTSIKIYMNQSSAGTVTITRNRADATYTFTGGSAKWEWDDVTVAQAFGTTVGQTNFMELTP